MGERNKNGVRHRGRNRRTLKSQRRLIYTAHLELLEDERGYLVTAQGKEALKSGQARRS